MLLVYLTCTLLLLAFVHRLILCPTSTTATWPKHIPALPYIPLVGHSLHLLYGFLINQPLSFGLDHTRRTAHRTFLLSFVTHPTIQTAHPGYIHSVLRHQYHLYDKGPISRATMEPIIGTRNAIGGERNRSTPGTAAIDPSAASAAPPPPPYLSGCVADPSTPLPLPALLVSCAGTGGW